MMMDLLRDMLALPENADATIREVTDSREPTHPHALQMMAYIEQHTGRQPGKSTLAEWLEGWLLVEEMTSV